MERAVQFEPKRVHQLIVTVEGIEYSFHEDIDGGIIATVVNYPSCQAYGPTLEEALDAVQETLQAILEDLESSRAVIPDDLRPFLSSRQARGL